MVEYTAQHSLDWYRSRLGSITGSMVGLLMKNGRNGFFSETAKSYIYQVAAEREMNPDIVNDDVMFEEYLHQVDITTKAMKFGSEQEADARNLYSKLTGVQITEVGSCKHPTIPHFASSPDGYIEDTLTGSKVALEIKCPNQATFMRYKDEIVEVPCKYSNGTLSIIDADEAGDNTVVCANHSLLKTKPEYFYQCMAHIACTGADYCVFIAYCAFQKHPIHIVRIYPDKKYLNEMEKRIIEANDIINQIADIE